MARDAEADEIAVEHIEWAKRQGLSPAETVRGIAASRWLIEPSWEDAIRAVARAWVRLRNRQAEDW